jgi:hypothetical protein
MYGPPPDCKKNRLTRNSPRKCIRPLVEIGLRAHDDDPAGGPPLHSLLALKPKLRLYASVVPTLAKDARVGHPSEPELWTLTQTTTLGAPLFAHFAKGGYDAAARESFWLSPYAT